MKLSTTPVSKLSLVVKAAIVGVSVLALVASPFAMDAPVQADRFDEQIRALKHEINNHRQTAQKLAGKADTLQRALNKLNNEQAQLQSQIRLSEAKHDKFVAEIKTTEQQITRNKDALGETLMDLYIQGDVTALEMLASSENIADFIDKQAYQENLRESLSERIKEIEALKKQLEQDKKSVERVIRDQKNQRQQLAAKQAEQQQLIQKTEGQEEAYRELSAKKERQISELERQQAAANRAALGSLAGIPPGQPGGGGYPGVWASAPINAYVDPWGLYTRQCVSYVAWKVASTGRYVPHFGGAGNAKQWPNTVAQYGIQSGPTPKAGAAAISYGGPYGHVRYVESVNGDGTITVSDYNLMVDGLYRHYTMPAAGLTYIYF